MQFTILSTTVLQGSVAMRVMVGYLMIVNLLLSVMVKEF